MKLIWKNYVNLKVEKKITKTPIKMEFTNLQTPNAALKHFEIKIQLSDFEIKQNIIADLFILDSKKRQSF